MMKKIFVLFFAIGLTVNSFSQKSIGDLNGFDWLGWDLNHKASFVQGFYSAQYEMLIMIYEFANALNYTQEQVESLMLRAYDRYGYEDSIIGMCEKLDEYYSSPSYRKYFIYKTIPFVVGKHWWNSQTGKVELDVDLDTLPPLEGDI